MTRLKYRGKSSCHLCNPLNADPVQGDLSGHQSQQQHDVLFLRVVALSSTDILVSGAVEAGEFGRHAHLFGPIDIW